MKPSEGGELGDIPFEPAREMRKQQCSLPLIVASPAKKVSKKFLEEEFPSDDSSGDEDYRPEEAVDKIPLSIKSNFCSPLEEMEVSFIEKDFTLDMYDTQCDGKIYHNFLSELVKPIDSTGTNDDPDDAENDPEYIPNYEDVPYRRNRTPIQKVPKKFLEEEFPDESLDDEDFNPKEELVSATPVSKATDLMSEDENVLVIAWPPELDTSLDPSKVDNVPLSIISNFCSPLEEMEASFSASDITFDMYNTQCDEIFYHNFLSELMKPIDSTGMNDDPDDAENDPEYIPNYEDVPYKRNRTTTDNLMIRSYKPAQGDLSFLDDEDKEGEPRVEVGSPESTPPLIWMTSDERLQLDEQLRMCVQLLTQSHLLSHGNSVLKSLNELTKIHLEEMKMFATCERASTDRSAFYAQNLDGALDIVKKFEDVKLPFGHINTKLTKRIPFVPSHIHQTLASSKVFIYPELLPKRGFRNTIELGNYFNTPEDNLIALGLEQFEGLGNAVECIHKYLIPVKSVGRIMTRIKFCRSKFKPLANSIKFYQKFKQAPKFQRVIRIFDPDNIKSPKDFAPDFLPKWMESFSRFSTSNPVTPGTIPAHSKKTSTEAALTLPPFRKTLRPRKYVPILPCGLLYIHPPAPILKKKSKKRPRAPSICDSESPYCPPPLRPKPRPHDSSRSKSNTASSDHKIIMKCNFENQDNVVTPLISDSPYKPRLYDSSSSESSITSSDNKKTNKCGVKIQENAFEPSISDSESPYELPSLKPKTRLSKAVWGALSWQDTSAATKSSKWKTAATDSDEGSCDDDEESEASIKINSKLKKRHYAKKKIESSARVESSKGKTVTTKVCDEVDDSTCDDEEEMTDSVIKYVSKMKKKGAKKKIGSSTGSRTSKRKCVIIEVCDEVDDKITDTEEESTASVAKDVSSRGKRQRPKTKTESSVDETDSDEVDEGSCDEKESEASVTTKCGDKNEVIEGTCDTEKESTTSAIQTASTMGIKKQNQGHRDFETSLALLQSDVEKEDPMKEQREVMFANSYLLRAAEILKGDSEVYEKFLSTLCKYHLNAGSSVELYSELQVILTDFPALARDFVVFLRPEEAKKCGRYKEHIALSKVREFFKKIEIHFKDQPEHISQILRTFAQLREQVDLTEVTSALQPLLKNQPHLFKELNDILSSPMSM